MNELDVSVTARIYGIRMVWVQGVFGRFDAILQRINWKGSISSITPTRVVGIPYHFSHCDSE